MNNKLILMSRRLVWSTLVLLLLQHHFAEAASLSKDKAQRAVSQCLKGNGSPVVQGVQEGQTDAVADVSVKNYSFTEPLLGRRENITGLGRASFVHYNDGRWVLRSFNIRGEFDTYDLSCNVEVGASSPNAPSPADRARPPVATTTLAIATTAPAKSCNDQDYKRYDDINGALLDKQIDKARSLMVNFDVNCFKQGYQSNLLTSIVDQPGSEETVKFLISKGANVNIANAQLWTPLMVAAHYGYISVVKLLIARGAKPNVQDGQGHTALTEARRMGHNDVVNVLIASGATQ